MREDTDEAVKAGNDGILKTVNDYCESRCSLCQKEVFRRGWCKAHYLEKQASCMEMMNND